jgi:hypothetical protein
VVADRPSRREDAHRDEPRRAEPRRGEGRRDEPRREETRRDEPRREESRREEPRWVEPRRDEPRRYRRDDDLGPSVVGFGDDVPAFMLLRSRPPQVAESQETDA